MAQVGEAPDRVGSIVTAQVRSIIETAEMNAQDIRREAWREANQIRREAFDAAQRVLQRMDSIEGPIGELVAQLRREVDRLVNDGEPRSGQ